MCSIGQNVDRIIEDANYWIEAATIKSIRPLWAIDAVQKGEQLGFLINGAGEEQAEGNEEDTKEDGNDNAITGEKYYLRRVEQ
mmetsp:Transcript_7566/g.13207  ORF Transcript_7566/g.13207 Transcript_7566/m.13207 type:complete len:83 (+) Transcript_7566:99-347(+)